MLLVGAVDRIIALGGPKRVGRRPARLPISYVAIGSEDVPIVGLGWGECSAGACPPLGRRRGVAESAVPIRRTKPQLQLFIPWCVGASRQERLL